MIVTYLATANSTRATDTSHITRPKLDPLIQQTLESVGMRARKGIAALVLFSALS